MPSPWSGSIVVTSVSMSAPHGPRYFCSRGPSTSDRMRAAQSPISRNTSAAYGSPCSAVACLSQLSCAVRKRAAAVRGSVTALTVLSKHAVHHGDAVAHANQPSADEGFRRLGRARVVAEDGDLERADGPVDPAHLVMPPEFRGWARAPTRPVRPSAAAWRPSAWPLCTDRKVPAFEHGGGGTPPGCRRAEAPWSPATPDSRSGAGGHSESPVPECRPRRETHPHPAQRRRAGPTRH